jgi:hypothetical protein
MSEWDHPLAGGVFTAGLSNFWAKRAQMSLEMRGYDVYSGRIVAARHTNMAR